MRGRLRGSVLVAGLAIAAASARPASAAESFLVIVSGLGGEDSYRESFHQWGSAMRAAAVDRYGLRPENVFYLAEDPAVDPAVIGAKSTKENVAGVFAELESKVKPGDQLYVLLIGHGSFQGEESRFNLPGRDLTAEDFDALLAPFSEQQIVFVNTTSASGGFLPVLAGPNRIVVTATKSGFERNESLFGKYFVEAYAGDGADTDKNERVSLLEAFAYARLRVDNYYDENDILKTEHAMFDDDGDGSGLHDVEDGAGNVARGVYLMGPLAAAAGFSESDMEADPELADFLERKAELEGRVEALRLQKAAMPDELYTEELTKLLLELARVSAAIEAKKP